MNKNRVLVCTFVSLMSGFFAAYVGAQVTATLHNQKCQNLPIVIKETCSAGVTVSAMWQGSTTGMWVGTILGAFASGSFTRNQRLGS
jgi:hypothetical protein